MRRDVDEINRCVHDVHVNIEKALRELGDSQPGFPTQSAGGSPGGRSLNDAGKPNGLDKFVIFIDPASSALDDLGAELLRARKSMAEVRRIVSTWSRDTVRAESERHDDDDECVACRRIMITGKRSGLCPACHQSWMRWKKSNNGYRHDWLTARRASIADDEARSEAS